MHNPYAWRGGGDSLVGSPADPIRRPGRVRVNQWLERGRNASGMTCGCRADDPLDLAVGCEAMKADWQRVDGYLAELLVGDDPALAAALAANAAAGLPAIDVSPLQGKLLHLLARMAGARRILEIGTLGGYSTIWLARALPDGRPAGHPGGRAAPRRGGPRQHRPRRPRRPGRGPDLGPALDTLPGLDGPVRPRLHRRRQAQQPRLSRLGAAARPPRHGHRLRQRDPRRPRSPMPPAATPASSAPARFFEMLAAEPRLSATAVQTVGRQGLGRLRHRHRGLTRGATAARSAPAAARRRRRRRPRG